MQTLERTARVRPTRSDEELDDDLLSDESLHELTSYPDAQYSAPLVHCFKLKRNGRLTRDWDAELPF